MKNIGIPLFRKLRLGSKSLFLGFTTYASSVLCAHALVNNNHIIYLGLAALSVLATLYLWWAFHASMKTDLLQLQVALEQVHAGDLRSPPTVNGQDELAALALELKSVMLTLSSVSAEIRSNAALVSQVGGQLNNQSKELSTRTEQQAASLEETSACLEEISSVVQLNAENSNNASAVSMTILDQAQRGVSSMEQAVKSVEQIKTHSTQMQSIMEAIDRLHTTAESHHRVLVIEVMGRHAGWIALHAGMAGGANVILIPEQPFDIERIEIATKGLFELAIGGTAVGTGLNAPPRFGELAAAKLERLNASTYFAFSAGSLTQPARPSAVTKFATSWLPTPRTGSKNFTWMPCALTRLLPCSTSTTRAKKASGFQTNTVAARTSMPSSSCRKPTPRSTSATLAS